ncbi:hypothetical protein RZN22_18880 [Bacillaceae bacterium S4-13-58]
MEKEIKVKMKYRDQVEHDEDFVFCRSTGWPFIQKNIGTRMTRLLVRIYRYH